MLSKLIHTCDKDIYINVDHVEALSTGKDCGYLTIHFYMVSGAEHIGYYKYQHEVDEILGDHFGYK